MTRITIALLALVLPTAVDATPPFNQGPEASLSVEDADTTTRHQYAGELSFLAPIRGSARGDSPFGLSFAYGLTGHTEVSLGLGSLSAEPNYRRDELDDFGDLAFGVKTRFYERGATALALAYGTTLLFADRNAANDRADQSLFVVGSETLGDLQLVGNLGTTFAGSSLHRSVPIASASALYDLHYGTGLLAQVNENQPQIADVRKRLELGVGVTQKIGSALEFQALLGRSQRGYRKAGLFLGATFGFGGGH